MAADRPAIPAALDRVVRMESAYKCGVCSSDLTLDLHHIVPWAVCLNHEVKNLIALCPNCHRKAEEGTIDRTALRQRKLINGKSSRIHLISNDSFDARKDTFVRFNPNEMLLEVEQESNNICAIMDHGILDATICFAGRMKDDRFTFLVEGNGDVKFRMVEQDSFSLRLKFEEPCPSVVLVRILAMYSSDDEEGE
jgi:hypothetical protein